MSDNADIPAEEEVEAKQGCRSRLTGAGFGVFLAVAALVLAVLALVGGFLVPEVRDWLGLDPTPTPTPTATPTPTKTPTVAPSPTAPGDMIGEGAWLCPDSTDGALYFGHLGSKKFHETWCRYGSIISPENRVCFDSRAAAIRLEYEPCGHCTPLDGD